MAPSPLTSVDVVTRSHPGIAALSHVTAILSAFLDRSPSLPLSRACAVNSVPLLQRIWNLSKSTETVAYPWCQPSNSWCPSRMLWTNSYYYQDQFAKGMVEACKYADVSTVQWLLDHFSSCVVPAQAVEAAAQRGQRRILQLLLRVHEDYKKFTLPGARALTEKPNRIQFWESNALLAAATGGHGDLVLWLYEDVFHGFYMQSNQEVMDHLARHGDIETVRRLVADGWQPPRLDFAAEGGNFAMVQWLLDDHIDAGKQWALKNAATMGHLDIVKLLVSEDLVFIEGQAFCDAAMNGHLPVVRWLKENNLGRNLAYKAIDLAASNGHLEIVKYLHLICSAKCTRRTMRGAASNGHLHVVQWLHTQFADYPDFDLYESGSKQQFNTTVMDIAAMNGHLDVMKFLHGVAIMMVRAAQLPGKSILEKTVPTCTPAAIQFVATGGHFEVLQWLHDNYWVEPSSDVVDVAASSGNLEMVKWLGDNAEAKFSAAAMDGAAREGHLAVVQWLHENSQCCTIKAVDDAASMGHLDVVQWLLDHRSGGCSIKALDGATSGDHFDVALLLASKCPQLCRPELEYINNMYVRSWVEKTYPRHE